jgi:hypothetical protein
VKMVAVRRSAVRGPGRAADPSRSAEGEVADAEVSGTRGDLLADAAEHGSRAPSTVPTRFAQRPGTAVAPRHGGGLPDRRDQRPDLSDRKSSHNPFCVQQPVRLGPVSDGSDP